jgi:hypothetical protein
MSLSPDKLAQLTQGYGEEAAQAIEAILLRAVSLGQSIATIASEITQALNTSLFRALSVAKNAITGAFRDSFMGTGRKDDTPIGWVWIVHEGACIACRLMSGTKHSMDEDMLSHLHCECEQEYYSAQDPPDVQSGEDWFNEQDDETQEDLLGPTKYAALENGDISIMDVLGTDSEGRIYVKTLKELGLSS